MTDKRPAFSLSCLSSFPCLASFASLASLILAVGQAQAAPILIAAGTLDPQSDRSGLSGSLESGAAADVLGGIGSGIAWAGGSTFLSVPDRGPNAVPYAGGGAVDNTQSYIGRFHTLDLSLTAGAGPGDLPYILTPTLNATTLLYSPTPLFYGSTPGLPDAVPSINTADKNYFTGRSDGFGPGLSTDLNDARFDPEAIRVSNDGKSVFVSDEYGPYVYQFDRATGERIKVFALPDHFAAPVASPLGTAEINGNTIGRVANKGMEGLAISPDGKTLIGFMQSPLIQDGGDGGRANRIVAIDVETGATREYAYDNAIAGKAYNSSEILALNDRQFLVLERDGKGLGDGSNAKIKQVWAVDLSGAADVSGMSGAADLLARAPAKTLFLDIQSALKAFGLGESAIPAKIEGMAFGQDILTDGILHHTLYITNDNDFVPGAAGPNAFYVFSFTDADLAASNLSFENQRFASVPEPMSLALMLLGLGVLIVANRRRARFRA